MSYKINEKGIVECDTAKEVKEIMDLFAKKQNFELPTKKDIEIIKDDIENSVPHKRTKRWSRHHKSYSRKDINIIKEMVTQGKKRKLIAKALGRTNDAIGYKIWEMKHDGKINGNGKAVTNGKNNRKKLQRFTEKEIESIKKLVNTGWKAGEIAKLLGRRSKSVHDKIWHMKHNKQI